MVLLKTLLQEAKRYVSFLKKKWYIIVLFTLLGVTLGYLYATLSATKYIAKISFIVEEGESKSSGPDLSMFGIETSDGNSNLFTGENLLWLIKSKKMLNDLLLEKIEINGKTDFIHNIYLDSDPELLEIERKIKKSNKDYKRIHNNDVSNFSKSQKQLLLILQKKLNKDVLEVKIEPLSKNVNTLTATSYNELLSYNIVNILINKVTEFYIITKTSKAKENLISVQKKFDQIQSSLNKSLVTSATTVEQIPFANPNLKTIQIPSQKAEINKQLISYEFESTSKQLQLAKQHLENITPIIHLVDTPLLPLDISKPSWKLLTIVGGLFFLILTILILIIYKYIRDILKNDIKYELK